MDLNSGKRGGEGGGGLEDGGESEVVRRHGGAEHGDEGKESGERPGVLSVA